MLNTYHSMGEEFRYKSWRTTRPHFLALLPLCFGSKKQISAMEIAAILKMHPPAQVEHLTHALRPSDSHKLRL